MSVAFLNYNIIVCLKQIIRWYLMTEKINTLGYCWTHLGLKTIYKTQKRYVERALNQAIEMLEFYSRVFVHSLNEFLVNHKFSWPSFFSPVMSGLFPQISSQYEVP